MDTHPLSRHTRISHERFLALADSNGFDLERPDSTTEQLGYTEQVWSNEYLDLILWTRDGAELDHFLEV